MIDRISRSASFCSLLAAAALTAAAALPASAQSTRIIVVEGDAAPDDNGTFSGFSTPVLNDLGQTAFFGALTGTAGGGADDSGIFLGDGVTGPTQIARAGQAAPDDNGTFSNLSTPALNDAGQTAFLGFLAGTTAGDSGIFRGDAVTGLTQIVRKGQATPDENGTFSNFGSAPALNDAGQTAFIGFLTGTAGGFADNVGIFRGDGVTGPIRIARDGQDAPDGDGAFSSFGNQTPALNDAGQAAFIGFLTGTAGGFADDRGIFRGDGVTGPTRIAREGQDAPDDNGTFSGFGDYALNDAGQTAFLGFLTGTTGGFTDDSGIFLGDGVTGPTQIARAGQEAPDGNGSFAGFNSPALNDAGQTAFFATLTDTSGGVVDNSGIFRGDGVTGLTQIARKGQDAPDGNGTFSDLDLPVLNGAGQIAFFSFLTGTDSGTVDNSGIFFFDDTLGLLTVARTGDVLLDSTITSLEITNGSSLGDERNGFNELGQIAYKFSLADGRDGIAVFSIPEPTSLALLGLGGLGLLSGRRRQQAGS